MHPLLFVLAILGGVAAVQAAVWIPLIMIWSKKRAEFEARFERERATSGEKILRGPEKAIYRGSTGDYDAVKGNGRIWLTDKRLVLCKVTGSVVELSTAKIRGTHEAKIFARSAAGGRVHLVVDTTDPAEVGFFVSDNAGWARDIASVAKSS